MNLVPWFQVRVWPVMHVFIVESQLLVLEKQGNLPALNFPSEKSTTMQHSLPLLTPLPGDDYSTIILNWHGLHYLTL